MSDFQHRIMALKAEVEALKTLKRKSSTTLATVTHTATCTATLYKDQYGLIYTRKAGAIEIIPDDPNGFIYSVAIPQFSSRGRNVRTFNWLFDNGNAGVALIPFGSSADNGMPNNSTKNITLTAYITATSDFSTSSSQLSNDTYGE